MKIAAMIARYLLGLIFVVFGLNGFFHFIPMSMPTGLAGQYMQALFLSRYIYFIAMFEVFGGLLLLVGRYVNLGVLLLGPIVANIVIYHLTLDHKGLPVALVVAALWCILFFSETALKAVVFSPHSSD
jgi:uncharacterized membrane protein YphA (DoxX/SURF4 family)